MTTHQWFASRKQDEKKREIREKTIGCDLAATRGENAGKNKTSMSAIYFEHMDANHANLQQRGKYDENLIETEKRYRWKTARNVARCKSDPIIAQRCPFFGWPFVISIDRFSVPAAKPKREIV